MQEFLTIKHNIEAELVEKKSKFIANLFYIENQKQAEDIIKQTKKKYYDARHNCVAYRVVDGDSIIEKSSDDGEPSGTAGAPMLNILQKNNLCNILVIVTRYFGGILLGTGGLVRAYSGATMLAIDKSEKVLKVKVIEADVDIEYNNLELFKYYCKNKGINITSTQFLDVVNCKIELETAVYKELLADINTKNIKINNIKVLYEKLVNKSVEK